MAVPEKNDSIRPLLKKLIPYMAVMNVVVYPITLIWGFDLSMIVGLVVGFFYSAACLCFLASTINSAVLRPVGRAKFMMFRCYILHYLGLGILGYLALRFRFMNFAGLLLPQFYPRMILGIMTFFEKRGNRYGRT